MFYKSIIANQFLLTDKGSLRHNKYSAAPLTDRYIIKANHNAWLPHTWRNDR